MDTKPRLGSVRAVDREFSPSLSIQLRTPTPISWGVTQHVRPKGLRKSVRPGTESEKPMSETVTTQ